MSIATEIQRLNDAKAALKAAINGKLGVPAVTAEKIDEYADFVAGIPIPADLPQKVFAAQRTASTTYDVTCNDHVRILGSDGRKYTIEAWNALFVAAGYDKNNMPVTPVGLSVDAIGHSGESYLFDRYTGNIYNVVGDAQHGEGKLQHSAYNNNIISAVGSGTDSVTGKAWTVTADGDEFVLYEANTGQSWRIAKNCGNANQHKAFNIADRTQSLWAQTEWYRHRFAIDSGVTTTAVDGTLGEVGIFNASGAQAAVGEDMYFFVRPTSADAWQATGLKAKYNLNNRHGVSGYSLTQAIADAIYARQIANGVNMNDTGVNSAEKPILSPGSKGAEAIAVGGKWYIITPYISNPNATTGTATNNMSDAPAVYWAKSKGYAMPSDTMLNAMYYNWAIVNSMQSYLNTVEGWGLPAIPTADYIWTAVRSSATGAWYVNLYTGFVYYYASTLRYFVVGASAS